MNKSGVIILSGILIAFLIACFVYYFTTRTVYGNVEISVNGKENDEALKKCAFSQDESDESDINVSNGKFKAHKIAHGLNDIIYCIGDESSGIPEFKVVIEIMTFDGNASFDVDTKIDITTDEKGVIMCHVISSVRHTADKDAQAESKEEIVTKGTEIKMQAYYT